VAPKTRGHIRGLMYWLFENAVLCELIPLEHNPMSLVEPKGVGKRIKPPRILTEEGVRGSAQRARPSLSLYGPSGGLYRPSYRRGHGLALDRDQLRKLGYGNQGRICSQPSHQIKIRVLPQDELPLDPDVATILLESKRLCPDGDWRLGGSRAHGQTTIRFWLVAEEDTQNRGTAGQDSRGRSAGTRCVTVRPPDYAG